MSSCSCMLGLYFYTACCGLVQGPLVLSSPQRPYSWNTTVALARSPPCCRLFFPALSPHSPHHGLWTLLYQQAAMQFPCLFFRTETCAYTKEASSCSYRKHFQVHVLHLQLKTRLYHPNATPFIPKLWVCYCPGSAEMNRGDKSQWAGNWQINFGEEQSKNSGVWRKAKLHVSSLWTETL